MLIEFARSPIARLRAWLSFADYDAAKRQATKDIISRYARGNVAFQNGLVLDEEDLAKLSANGDRAIARLKKASSK